MAISASGACRLPTCLCARPCWLRIKISHNGHSVLVKSVAPRICLPVNANMEGRLQVRHHSSHLLSLTRCLFLSISRGRFPHPLPLVEGLDPCTQALAVARPISLDNIPELVPIRFAVVVMAAGFVPLQVWIRKCKPEVFPLRDGLVDKFLAQFVIGEEFDFPLHGLCAVG